jgi:membrane protease YdiL (CAAX protease family)
MDAMSHNEEVKEAISAEPFEPAAPLLPIDSQLSGQTIEQSENVWTPKPPQPKGIAPVWHTLILVLGILAFSIWGSARSGSPVNNPFAPVHSATNGSPAGTDHVRLIRYALTGTLEILVVIWVAFGLRLRKVSFRSLFGKWPRGLNDITMEAGVALAFWICSMIVLVSIALCWGAVQNGIYKHQTASQSSNPSKSDSAKPKSPQQQQAEMARQLMELAPADGIEVASWGLLCLIVGFSEEVIFRGYLQSQSIALLRSVPIAVAVTAVIFGAAHGYQGLRGIVLISAYGGLFGCITLLRKNLFPGMLAHAWHDFATGMLLAFIRSTHLLERLPLSH